MNSPVEPMAPEQSENKVALSVVQTAGAQLSAARIQQGMSLQQVAEQLKLSQRQILALENNQFELLPKMVIVRGFVRSYAKLLRLDPAPMVACLPTEAVAPGLDADLRPTLATPFMESRTPFLGRQENNNRKYLIGAALLAVFAMLFVGGQKLEQSGYFKGLLTPASVAKTPEELNASVEAAPASVASVGNESAAENKMDAPASSVSLAGSSTRLENQEQAASAAKLPQDVSPAPITTSVKVPAPVATSVAASVAAVAAAPVSVASLSTPLVVASPATVQTGNNQFKLKFKQDSWIQVKRENGTIITSHLAKAGTEEFFDLKDALQVRIGNAVGVEGWVRGNAMAIVPGKDSNVVNLNVK
ncbi:helix-turn-helix domain-containing protein [Undibacterium sp. Ji50W]|uniref:helix-turn-helix domain-containing protein n=1 Tax=Undibacterium sp. Ji50W TaxID=3413041 RepID=UPI003BF41295